MLIYLQYIETEEDKQKFITMYDTHKQWMHGYAMKFAENYHDAEDAVHQAFLYIAKNMDKVSEADCPKTKGYLAIITKHAAIDIVRKRKTVDYELDWIPYEEKFYEESPLTAAIMQLPERDQDALLLRFQYGYSVHELAKFYNMKYDAMQKRLLRAKQALEKILDQNGVEI